MRILWLTQSQTEDTIYNLDYRGEIPFKSVLTNVTLEKISEKSYRLSAEERVRIEEILTESLRLGTATPYDPNPIVSEGAMSPEKLMEGTPYDPNPSRSEKAITPERLTRDTIPNDTNFDLLGEATPPENPTENSLKPQAITRTEQPQMQVDSIESQESRLGISEWTNINFSPERTDQSENTDTVRQRTELANYFGSNTCAEPNVVLYLSLIHI